MKLNYLLLTGLAAVLGAGDLAARTWTSADGTKTFEGDFRSYDAEGKKVTVIMRNGRSITFDVAKLSEADKTFVEEEAKKADAPEVLEALKDQKIGAGLTKKGVLQKLEEGNYQDYQLDKAPDYYLIYFGASW